MISLYDFINEAYHQYGQHRGSLQRWENIEDFLYDPQKSLMLMSRFLDLGVIGPYNELNLVSLYRSQHILVTFLLGLGLAKHYKMLDGVNCINSMPDEYLWMLTSTVHDFGYLKKEIMEAPKLCNVDEKYGLLRDSCETLQLQATGDYSKKWGRFLTYSYDVIKAYYDYRKDTISAHGKLNKDNESVDHGIFGACQCYKEYCDYYIKYEYPHSCISPEDDKADIASMGYEYYMENTRPEIVELARTEPILYKTACLIAAQHNIFRSSNPDSDILYEKYGLTTLLSITPIAVTKENPLLYLLSIVDTIECTKCFQNVYLPDDVECKNPLCLSIKDIIKHVGIELTNDGIIMDYTPLKDFIDYEFAPTKKTIEHKMMLEQLNRQIRNAAGIGEWMQCKSKGLEPGVIQIKF